MSISSLLIANIRWILQHCIREVKNGTGLRQANNAASMQAIPAYFTAVAALEAFLNEQFLGIMARMLYKDNPLWYIPSDDLEHLSLEKKLLLVPKFLFQQTFDEGTRPYQEIKTLIQVRNYLTHYKMDGKAPNSFLNLEQRKITLRDEHKNATLGWVSKLSCTEGIRWAHNTVCDGINTLLSFADANYDFERQAAEEYDIYKPISENMILQWYKDL
jgi:hypothetical protein